MCIYSILQGRFQDLARGGAQTVVEAETQILLIVSCCIFEAANNAPLSSISLLIFTILAFVDGFEVLKVV